MTHSEECTTDRLIPIVCPFICYSVSLKKVSVSSISEVILSVLAFLLYLKVEGKGSIFLHTE